MARKCSMFIGLAAFIEPLISYNLNAGEVSFTKYRKVSDRKWTVFFRDVIAWSPQRCCIECKYHDFCFGVSYQNTTGKCLLSSEFDIGGIAVTAPGWALYHKEEWLLVFRAVSGVGSDPYSAWTTGSSTTNDPSCVNMSSNTCSQHYRNTIVNSWSNIGKIEVKFSIYKHQAEKAHIIFDGVGTDLENWFDQSKVISSNWPNLKTGTYLHFSIAGSGSSRRFYIVESYSGCQNDPTYTAAITSSHGICDYDTQPLYPQFLFSTTDGMGQPNSMTGMDLADDIAIFIRAA